MRQQRTESCRAPWAQRAPVRRYWDMAAACLRLVRAEPPAVNAFLPLSPLCQCVGSAAVIVYFCCAWGGKGLPKEGKAFIRYLCRRLPDLDRPTFDAAFDVFCEVTGTDVRGFGPSTYEFVLCMGENLTQRQKIRAARHCLVWARQGDPRSAQQAATEIFTSSAAPEGRAGNLVALLAANR